MKTQLKNRLGSEATERIIRRFHNGELSLSAAQQSLGVGKSQVYNLRAQWLASRKAIHFQGLSSGDHSKAWPPECVAHLKTLIESSIDDGPNFELYADELERKFGFQRDRTNVRRFCEVHLSDRMRRTFSGSPKRSHRPMRRWACASYGELWQHDSTPRHIWGGKSDCQSILLSIDDATRKIMACRICERESVLEHFAMLEEAFLRHGLPETLYTDGFSMFGAEGEDLQSQFGRMCRAFGIAHRIAPTPQAKGKVERAMRTFQHRLVVTLRAEVVTASEPANAVAARHIDFWNAHHANDEIGATPDACAAERVAAGQCRLRPVPDVHVLRLFLSQHVARRVESRCRIDFMGASGPSPPRADNRFGWPSALWNEASTCWKPNPIRQIRSSPPSSPNTASDKPQPSRPHRVGHPLMASYRIFSTFARPRIPLLLARQHSTPFPLDTPFPFRIVPPFSVPA
jgi:hypothetical protein